MATVWALFNRRADAEAARQALQAAGVGDPTGEADAVAGPALATGLGMAALMAVPLIGPALAWGPLQAAAQDRVQAWQAELPADGGHPPQTRADRHAWMVRVVTNQVAEATTLLERHGGRVRVHP